MDRYIYTYMQSHTGLRTYRASPRLQFHTVAKFSSLSRPFILSARTPACHARRPSCHVCLHGPTWGERDCIEIGVSVREKRHARMRRGPKSNSERMRQGLLLIFLAAWVRAVLVVHGRVELSIYRCTCFACFLYQPFAKLPVFKYQDVLFEMVLSNQASRSLCTLALNAGAKLQLKHALGLIWLNSSWSLKLTIFLATCPHLELLHPN